MRRKGGGWGERMREKGVAGGARGGRGDEAS